MSTPSPSFTEALARLVAIPSVSSVDPDLDMSNRAMVDELANWLSDLGFRIDLNEIPGHAGKVNLIARLGPEGTAHSGLVLSGHTDTVPYDESGWDSDPFTLTERNGRLYGLGSSDMKCFFPIITEVMRGLDTGRLRQPLTVLATADEESNMYGAQALVDAGIAFAGQALIGEPTGLQPIYTHKGVMLANIRLIGRSGHSSDPALGENALEGMHDVIHALLEWREELQVEHMNTDFRVPVPTLNLGRIAGGDNPNRICASCELGIDLRPLPGMSVSDLEVELHRRVAAAVADRNLKLEFSDTFHGIDAMQTPRDAEVVRVAEQLSGMSAGSVAFGTEGPYLNALGMATVVLGPGDIAVAHQQNEYVPMERIVPMQNILEGMIRHFCLEQTA